MVKKNRWNLRLIGEIILLALFLVVGALVVGKGVFLPPVSSPPSYPVSSEATFMEARYWVKLDRERLQCQLCFRQCLIPERERGYCGVRENRGGRLYTLVYGRPCSITPGSPMEKLPLYHVWPGSLRYNVATAGCNFKCTFCQNWHIATRKPEEVESLALNPEEVVREAMEYNLQFIAFTYTEPTVFYEFMYDICKLAKERGLKTLLNTNGAMNPVPLRELLKYLDAVNVDLKAFTSEFYQLTSLSDIKPVLNTIKVVREEGVWLEIVNLVIPTLNDDMEKIREMCLWIKDNIGVEVPIHFNRFFPAYKLTRLPPTPIKTLEEAREIAIKVGLKYVYIGNVPGHKHNSTFCPGCGELLIERVHFSVLTDNVMDGECKFCGHHIPGIWE